jgi:2,3-bisphosphoglycerate-dependent phosphoglycerate mutase
MPIRVEDGLKERRLAAARVDDFPAAVAATWADFDFAHPGGESNLVAQARVVAAIQRIVRATHGGRVVVATHGNALALYLNSLDREVGYAFWAGPGLPNAFVVAIGAGRRQAYQRLKT